jgi:hypothetical protein
MADMDVDSVEPTSSKAKGKAKEDGKDGKQKFEVKKVSFNIWLAVDVWIAEHFGTRADFSGTQ